MTEKRNICTQLGFPKLKEFEVVCYLPIRNKHKFRSLGNSCRGGTKDTEIQGKEADQDTADRSSLQTGLATTTLACPGDTSEPPGSAPGTAIPPTMDGKLVVG